MPLIPVGGCDDEFMSESENVATLDAVPAKSKQKYEKQFQLFDTWRKEKCFEGVTEEMMMEYLQSIGEVYKPSSLWTRLSMLKATLKAYENVDISSFSSLFAYLKGKSKHHKAKKSKALNAWQIQHFLTEAPDSTYLLMKVVLIIGISGGCCCEELTKLTLDNIEDKGSHLLVTLPTHTENKPRKFIVINDTFGMDVLGFYYKYLSLRPANLTHNRLFLNYRKDKFTVQPVGIHTLSKFPKEIATYLNLPDSDTYTDDEFITELENVATLDALPAKSKERYGKQYQLFDTWRKEKCFERVTEEVMMEYLQCIEKVYKPTSLWTRLSMLKATLKAYENVDISSFSSLFTYLKGISKHHKAKKAKALEAWQIQHFLTLAPDSTYLLMKVALIIGISGGCNCEELTKLTLDNIEDKGSHLLVTLPTHTENKPRKFIIINDTFGMDVLGIYYKYLSLRPANITHNRLFLNYKKDKCTVQPVGVNTLSKIPKEIATYLQLPDADIYTGHSFRRSAVTLLAHK